MEKARKIAMRQKWEGTWDSRWSVQTSKNRLSQWTDRLEEGKPAEGMAEPKMTVTVENIVFRKHRASCKQHMHEHTGARAYTRTQAHARDKPLYTHIVGWTGSYQGYQKIRRAKGERLAEDRFAFLLQLNLFKSSLRSCVRVRVRLPAAVWLTAVILLSQ